jgi:branched-chain amino acid aminotransferase/para-aminobenzoate synthetase component 1
MDGRIVDEREALLPVTDRGVLFGDGIFETVLAHRGVLAHFGEHIARLRRSLEAFRISPVHEGDLASAAAELLLLNELTSAEARVRIAVTRGSRSAAGLPSGSTPTVIMTAVEWQRPAAPWTLLADPSLHHAPLARHKTLNYLHHLACRQRAIEAEMNDALLFTYTGEICESTVAALLLRIGGVWVASSSPARLPSISERHVLFHLRQRGFHTESRPLRMTDLELADGALLCNALLVAHPVARIDTHALSPDTGALAEDIRRRYFEAALER